MRGIQVTGQGILIEVGGCVYYGFGALFTCSRRNPAGDLELFKFIIVLKQELIRRSINIETSSVLFVCFHDQ